MEGAVFKASRALSSQQERGKMNSMSFHLHPFVGLGDVGRGFRENTDKS